MKALIVERSTGMRLSDVPIPRSESECLIRVTMAGICGTDLQILEGYAGFEGIPGHEFVGTVEAAPSGDEHWIGKRVVGEINVGCGRCEWCARGVKEHCTDRAVVGIRQHGGAFAEFLTLPSGNLHALPEGVDDESAVFVEPLAAACRIFEQVNVRADARIAVVGDGRMGLLTAQVLRTVAHDVTIFGRHEKKLAVARSLGVHAIASGVGSTPDGRYDIVVDVTGRPAGFARALELVEPRGTLVLKSTFHGEAPIESWPIVVDEVSIVGSRCGPFPPAIELLAQGKVRVKPLVSRVTALGDYESAFEAARHELKVLFKFTPDPS